MRRPLLISHNLSYTGAPIALLALAKALQRLGENPFVAPLGTGPLKAKFLEAGIDVVTDIDRADVSLVIANTAISVPTALRFKRAGTPIAAWIHESAYFFAHADMSPREFGLEELDVVLGPAKFQLAALEPFLNPGTAYQLRNLVRQESFRPPGDESMFAVCGQWEPRKGQAQLLELARRATVNCQFKFIGAEPPAEHADASAPLSQHKFLGLIDPDEAKIEIARCGALVSCAEAEVQPLGAIEALMAGRPVLLSDIDAHRALANLVPNVFLFDRESPQSFRDGLAKLRDALSDEAVGGRASAVAKTLFGEMAFDRRLADIMKVLRKDAGSAAAIAHYQDP